MSNHKEEITKAALENFLQQDEEKQAESRKTAAKKNIMVPQYVNKFIVFILDRKIDLVSKFSYSPKKTIVVRDF